MFLWSLFGAISLTDSLSARCLHRDGYILIAAYNTAIQKASASWGFVVEDDIHDTIEIEQEDVIGEGAEAVQKPKDWTFRRAGNLRAWGA